MNGQANGVMRIFGLASAAMRDPLSRPIMRTCLIAGAVLAFDLLAPPEVTAAALYMAAVLSAVPIRRHRAVIATAAVCSVLLAIGTAVSPNRGEADWWLVIINNFVALLVVWGTALMADAWLRVQRKQSRQAQENQLLLQAMSLSVMSNSLEDALRSCVTTICEIANWPVGHVYFRDTGSDRLVSSDIWTLPNVEKYLELRRVSASMEFSRGAGIPGRLWETRQSAWFQELDDPRIRQVSSMLPLRGAFGFPIVADEEVIAVVEFFAHSSDAPEAQLLLLVGSVGQQLGQVAERRRRVAERSRIAAIVESSYDGIIGRDLDGHIISWNKGAELVYGYTEEEAIGQTVRILLPENLTDEEPVIAEALRDRRRLTEFETTRRRKNGQVIHVALTVSPIVDSRDRLIGSSTIERDITFRRRREQELEAARAAAEYANQAKSTILANVSHELRTPMNAVLGMLDLALSESLADGLRDYLDTARDSACTLLHLLNDLLDVSRMEAGRFELEHAVFDPRETIEGAVRALSIRASEKGLELALRIARDVPCSLTGDGFRLGQIVTNLAGNALKFTEQGEVVVDVSNVSQRSNHVQLQIIVRDTGVGIAPEHQQRIFEPFLQVDPSSTRRQAGSGLGLAICREIASKMQGRVWLESTPGQGSTFYCTAWFDRADIDEGRHEDVPDWKGQPVLVVDDNATIRRILCEKLSDLTMQPQAVDGGIAALELLESANSTVSRYAALLVDALMPGMDGFTFVESVISRYQDACPPIILMLTATDRQTFRTRIDMLEIDTILEKPVTTSALREALHLAIRGTRCDEAVRPFDVSPQPRRVLLVEDMPANQKFMRAILEKRGHLVRVAGNGREAIEQLKQEEFDVVLMDVQMPTMDGLQATRMIRRLDSPRSRQVPIVALTAHARREDHEQCLSAGMDAALEKPVNISDVFRVVETIQTRQGDGKETGFEQTELNGTEAVVDLDAARRRMDGNEALLTQMARFFLDDVPALLSGLKEALDADDAAATRRAAHSIRGLAANFDAHQVTVPAQRIEDVARGGDLASAVEIIPLLTSAIERVGQRLRCDLNL